MDSDSNKTAVNKTKRWALFVPLLLCLFFGIALYYAMGNDPYNHDSVQQNKPIPVFSAENLLDSDNAITHNEFYQQITLLNVWASWCGVCQTEHDFLLQLASQSNITLYGLNYRDQKSKAIEILDKKGNPFTKTIFDPQGKVALELGVYGTPETYLIDQNGIIRFRYSGALTSDIWQTVFVPQIDALKVNRGEQ